MALEPGEIIDGKYRIVRLVGEGGMGAVYEGENTRIKRRVAIKVLHAAVAEKTDVVQRFEREAQAAGRIGSEHIVEVLDLGSLPSGERFMVMEFLDGEDLTSRIKKRKRLTPQEAVPLISQVLEGLAAAHDAGIVHRDLKPDNIFILSNKAGRSDFVKILDFGVSKFSALDNEMSMTRTGAVMGTPYYMSPEQAKGGTVDARSDLYAIGVVLYQAVTGRVPFNAGSFNELLFKIALESPEPIQQVVPDCPPAFAAMVERAMQRDPEHRFQSAREFQQALNNWLMSAPTTGARTEALPAFPDLTGQSGQHAALGSSGPPMNLGGPPLHPSGPGPAPGLTQAMSSHPFAQEGFPQNGGYPTTGEMGVSQSALAVTQGGQKKRGGLVFALVAVSIGIIGAAAFGAYILVRGSAAASAGETQTETAPADSAQAATSASSDPDAADSAGLEPADSTETADSAAPEDAQPADSADSAEPAETPAPKVAAAPTPVPRPVPVPAPVPRPVPKPTPKPAPAPAPQPQGGRNFNTEL